MGNERRKHERVDLGGHATVEGGSSDLHCRVVNLSRSGALIRSNKPLQEMDMVNVNATFDCEGIGQQQFACEAAVVRCTKRADGEYDIGLFFTAMDPTEQERLERIRQNTTELPTG